MQGLYTDVVGPSDDALYDEPSATQGNRHVCKFVFCRAVWLHALWKGRERERGRSLWRVTVLLLTAGWADSL